MAGTYCEEGQTAVVTLPNGAILNLPGPITIECSPLWYGEKCDRIYFRAGVIRQGATTPPTYTELNGQFDCWAQWTGEIQFTRYNNGQIWGIEVRCRGAITQPCRNDFVWLRPLQVNTGWINEVQWVRAFKRIDNEQLFPKVTLDIKNSLGIILHTGLYDACNYSVQCIGCPAGTLNCGDCCLPCDSTFNALSSMRAMIQKITRGVPV